MEEQKVSDTLNKLPFVNWDRYFEYESGASYFGWIDREDKKKDFVVVDLFKDGTIGYATSSEKYTKEIAEILNCTHSECKRIEIIEGVKNAFKLRHGITIIGVKVVGICSKCRREGDEIMKNKDNSIIPDEELCCVGCALQAPIDAILKKPVKERTQEEHLRLIKDKFNGRVRDYLLSMGAFKE